MLWVIKYRKIFYTVTILITGASIVALAIFGLNLGIDFTGGTIWKVEFKNSAPSVDTLNAALLAEGVEPSVTQPVGDKGFILRFRPLEESQHQTALSALKTKFGDLNELEFSAIGPSIGKELRDKAIYAVILSILAVVIYIAWSFRKVEKVVSSWAYGIFTIAAMAHDIFLPLGVFAVLGKYLHYEITSVFVAAILTIAGYSITDTIVVFDRVRENLRRHTHDDFNELVGASLKQTLARSINTTLATVLVLLAIYFFGGESTKHFALALIIGLVSGAYSSIFIASPLLVTWGMWRNK
ncbi:MAG: protein translocase subunit SecF [Patescibacteria group bacterium]